MKVKSESEVTQSCPTLSDLMDCSLPGSSVHGIFQASVLEWGAIAFSTQPSLLHCNCPLCDNSYFRPSVTDLFKSSRISFEFIGLIFRIKILLSLSHLICNWSEETSEIFHGASLAIPLVSDEVDD